MGTNFSDDDHYLSYNPARRANWVEHDSFPVKAIKYWRDGLPGGPRLFPPSGGTFEVYRFCADRCHLFRIDEKDWDVYTSGP